MCIHMKLSLHDYTTFRHDGLFAATESGVLQSTTTALLLTADLILVPAAVSLAADILQLVLGRCRMVWVGFLSSVGAAEDTREIRLDQD